MSAARRRAPVPDTTVTERSRQPALGLALPVELEARRADDDGRVGVVGLQRGERLRPSCRGPARRPGTCAAPAARRRRRRAGTAAARRRARPRPRAAARRARASGGRPRSPRRARARRRSSTSAAFGADLDAERAQVVLERLEQVRVDRQRAAVRLAGGQREEGGDRLRVPVDVELEARLPDALDQRQRGRRRARARPAGAGRSAARALVEARALALEQRLGDLRGERQPQPAAALVGQRGELLRQLAGDRLQHEAPAPPSLPAPTRPTQPVTASASHASTSGATFSQAWRSITPLTYGAVASACGAHHSLRVPVEAAAGDRAHGVDHLARYGKEKTTDSWPWRSGAARRC